MIPLLLYKACFDSWNNFGKLWELLSFLKSRKMKKQSASPKNNRNQQTSDSTTSNNISTEHSWHLHWICSHIGHIKDHHDATALLSDLGFFTPQPPLTIRGVAGTSQIPILSKIKSRFWRHVQTIPPVCAVLTKNAVSKIRLQHLLEDP